MRALKNLPAAANAFQKGGSTKENGPATSLFVPTGAAMRGNTPSLASAASSGTSRAGSPEPQAARDGPTSAAERAAQRARAASEQIVPRNVELARAYAALGMDLHPLAPDLAVGFLSLGIERSSRNKAVAHVACLPSHCHCLAQAVDAYSPNLPLHPFIARRLLLA